MYLSNKEKGKHIIIPEKGNEAALYAGEQLKKYLYACMNLSIDICFCGNSNAVNRIYIGGEEYKSADVVKKLSELDLNTDGFVLRITENNIYIDAQNGRGLIFGVYRFLEKYLSVRFFNAECERVPKVNELNVVPCVIVERPEFPLRSYLNGELWELGGKNVDLYLKHKLNNEHIVVTEKKYGGRCSMFGRNGTHNMSTYVPYEKYKDSHPEFYYYNAELGYRTIDLLNGITEDCQIDESKEVSVFKIVLEEMKKDIIANPDISYFQFEQEDGNTIYPYEKGSPQDKIVKKYGRSGILIRFCNLLLRSLQKWSNENLGGRKISIVTFAYSYTTEPPIIEENGKVVPIDETVVADENLVIRLAMGTSFVNAGYHYFHPKNKEFIDKVNAWKAVCSKFMVWCYDMDDVTHLWYYPVIKNAKKNIFNFKKLGAVYLMFEAACSSIRNWQTDIRGYIYSNLMWNSTQSVNELFNEYMDGVYGVASDEIKKIVMIFENYCLYVREIYDGYYASTRFWSYRHADTNNEGLINRALALCDKAEEKIKELEKEQRDILFKRIQAVRVTFLHMKMNKINYEFYKSVENSGTTQFSGDEKIPKNKGQTIHNVEMEWMVTEKLIIPDDVAKKIKELNPLDIPDYINFDKV